MSRLGRLVDSVSRPLAALGVCGNAGLIVGMMTGGVLGLLDLLEGPLAPAPQALLVIWGATALFGWITLLFLFVALSRWSFSSVAFGAFVNALMSSGVTIVLCWAFAVYAWAWWIGIVAGAAVGLLLCAIQRLATGD